MAITIKNMGGGAELTGNASTDNVLSGKTFYNTDGTKKLTGTMPNKGAITQTLEPQQTFYIPKGYHNGSGTVKGLGHTNAEYNGVVNELNVTKELLEELKKPSTVIEATVASWSSDPSILNVGELVNNAKKPYVYAVLIAGWTGDSPYNDKVPYFFWYDNNEFKLVSSGGQYHSVSSGGNHFWSIYKCPVSALQPSSKLKFYLGYGNPISKSVGGFAFLGI